MAVKEKMAKGVLTVIKKSLKTFGINADDIIGMLEAVNIDNYATDIIEGVKAETGAENIVLVAYTENNIFSFRAIELIKTENGMKLGESHHFMFFGERKIKLTITELIGTIIKQIL